MAPLSKISLIAALACYALAAPLETRGQNCVKGVMVVAARGSDPDWTNPAENDPAYADLGTLGDIATAVTKAVGHGSFVNPVPYPATTDGYDQSMGTGIDTAQGMIRDYVDACKDKVNPKIVVLGYSQGAQVLSSALVGGDGRPDLNKYKQYIVAGALFADPSFIAGKEPLDAGNAHHSGTLPKTSGQKHDLTSNYGHKIRSYCHAGDVFCASGNGPQGATIHENEVSTYQHAATQFLKSKLKGVK